MRIANKRLLYFIIFLVIVLTLNVVYFHVLSLHSTIITLMAILLFFHFIFVFEKDRVRYEKRLVFETIIFLVAFFVLYYLLGIFIGISKTNNYFTWQFLSSRTLPMIIYIILREILRSNLLRKASDDKLCMFFSVLLFILMDLSCSITYASFNTKYEVLKFITVTLNPIVAKNISYSHIINNSGYKPIVVFDLIFTLYPYVFPIVPKPSEYVSSIINMLLPVVYVFKLERFFLSKNRFVTSGYFKKKFNDFFIPVTIAIILVYFFSGYFRYYAIAVASESMSPTLNLGDLVILDQRQKNLKESDIIAYKRNDKIIIHRINKIIEINDEYYYYTKGDVNENIDDVVVESNMIVGKVKFKIPCVGYPTVWFNKE